MAIESHEIVPDPKSFETTWSHVGEPEPDEFLRAELAVGGVFRVEVTDKYVEEASLADMSEEIDEYMTRIAALKDNGEVVIRKALSNPVSREAYAKSKTLEAWQNNIPTAFALWPLYHPDAEKIPVMRPTGQIEMLKMDAYARDIFVHCYDGIGIRARASVMQMLLDSEIKVRSDGVKLVSLASGTAEPTLDLMRRYIDDGVSVALFDKDMDALELAKEMADSMGLNGRVTTNLQNIFEKDLPAKAGRHHDLADGIGIWEYLRESSPHSTEKEDYSAKGLLRTSHELVKPGGKVVIGNMLDTHPQLIFTKYVVGWPIIIPRSPAEAVQIIENTGINKEDVEVYLPYLKDPGDAVYALYVISKRDSLVTSS